jgi:hypothetical protein
MRPLSLCLLAGVLAAAPAGAGERLTDADFARLHALIKPNAREEAWLQVPWRTNLWQARKEAAAVGKPLLLWEMDGHPLGCT